MKKKIFTLSLILTSILTYTFYSCSSDDKLQELNNYTSQSFRKLNLVSHCTIENENDNPYHNIGKAHNQIIQRFNEKYSFNNIDYDLLNSNIHEISNELEIYKDLGLEKSDFEILSETKINQVLLDVNNNFYNVINDLNLSYKANNKLKEVFTFIFNEASKEKSPEIDNINNRLIDYEKQILLDNDYNENDRKIMLSTIATARFSTCYWYHYYDQENNFTTLSDSKPKKRWWQWLIIGAADAIGAGVGSSIPGFVGTVYGAVKTSITANEIIEHIFVIEENNE